MEAIREIGYIHNHKLSVDIPETFNYEKVEVVILPLLNNKIIENSSVKSLRGILKNHSNVKLIEKEKSAWNDSMEKKYEDS